jgi:phosphoglucosamine mutase
MTINQAGGATHPAAIQAATKEHGADFGVAFDGDADRAIFSDSEGRLINGDRVLAIWAKGNSRPGDVIVGTVMSNQGFENYLASIGIRLERAAVGDKYVSAMIDQFRAGAGGEQSGHTIFPALGPTGDGIGTALQVLAALQSQGITLKDAYDDFANWPQFMVNVKVSAEKKAQWKELLAPDLDAAERQMISPDRILVRASGTSPTIRVMVEAQDETTARLVTESLVQAAVTKLEGKPGKWIDLRTELAD